MNEVFELLESANNYLINIQYDIFESGAPDEGALDSLIQKINQVLHEWEILKTGNLART